MSALLKQHGLLEPQVSDSVPCEQGCCLNFTVTFPDNGLFRHTPVSVKNSKSPEHAREMALRAVRLQRIETIYHFMSRN